MKAEVATIDFELCLFCNYPFWALFDWASFRLYSFQYCFKFIARHTWERRLWHNTVWRILQRESV